MTATITSNYFFPSNSQIFSSQQQKHLSLFRARWGKEEERRLELSLKAQRAFQQAQESLLVHSSNTNSRQREGVPAAPASQHEICSVALSGDGTVENEGSAPHEVAHDVQTLEERLWMRERTIQRLQTELDSTRATYEATIVRMQEEHTQSIREAKQEIAGLKEQLSRFVLAGESQPHAVGGDACAFLDVLEFKERMLQQMHDAFVHACDEWKSGTMQAVTGMRVVAEEEIRGITCRAESLVLQLQEALSALGPCGTPAAGKGEAVVMERLLQEESTLLAAYDGKLQEHVRAAVRSAVRAHVRDIAMPLVKDELSRRPGLYMQGHRSGPPHPREDVEAAGTTPPPSEELLSPADARYREALALFQELKTYPEPCVQSSPLPQGQQQPRPRETSSEGVAAGVLDGLLQGVALRHASPDESARPPWLDRHR